jgi:murein DD-endopeptidase MepM/ murein hydrolase activator NlpD
VTRARQMPSTFKMWLSAIAVAILGVIALAILGVARPDGGLSDEALNRLVTAYSAQRVIGLNVGETYAFQLRAGGRRVLKLASVREHRDSVVNLMRRADVQVEIDGKPLALVCEPYTMPTESGGLRLLADSTAGWGNVPKAVQFSLWDAADPIVDTSRFGFPVSHYRLFSHLTQCYNEPVHIGERDGDPAGQRFYHDYGFDMVGYEGKEDVVSAIEGKVALFWPDKQGPSSVVVQDSHGFYWSYAHMQSLAPGIVLGAHVNKGQKIGALGKTGPSSNSSCCHLGSYVTDSPEKRPGAADRDHRLNLYPWYVAAYQAQHPKGLLAIARPHRVALTGERIVLDGSHSLAWGGSRIVERRWVLPDGSTITNNEAHAAFTNPGAYVATLWVKDDQGNEDADFCQIKVFSKSKTEANMPHLFLTYTPTEDLQPKTPIAVRLWFQGANGGPISLEFDDGERISDYQQYTEVQHSFDLPGVRILTAQCEAAGNPITAKIKVVVNPAR